MNISQELSYAISSCLRMCLMAVLGQSIGLLISNTMMKRKKSIKVLAIGVVLKSVLLLIFTCWIDYCFPTSDIGQVAVALSNFWGVAFVSVLFAYTYEGGVLKCIIGMSLAELVVSVLVLPSVILINTLEGREYVTSFSGALMWMDIGIIVLAWVMALVLYPVMAPFLRKYRNFIPKHKKVIWSVIVIYFFVAQLMPILGVQNNRAFVFTMFFLYLFCSAGVVLYGVILYRRYRKRIQMENEWLQMERKLMEEHYIATRKQIYQMESSRQLMEAQMQKIVEKSKGSEENHQRISLYLEELRMKYEQIQSGMYCNDWLVDAVLYCQIETAKRQGIEVECSLQGYDRGCIREEDLVRILYQLFIWGMQLSEHKRKMLEEGSSFDRRKMELHMGAIKNQLIIQFLGTGKIKNKYLLKSIQRFAKMYSGMITIKNGFSVEIVLKRN